MLTPIQYVGQLIRVILVAKFIQLNWIIIKQVYERCQPLNPDHFILFVGSRVILWDGLVAILIPMLLDDRPKHLVDVVTVFFIFEISEKHFFKSDAIDQPSFILDFCIQLFPKIVQNSVIQIKSVNLFNHFYSAFILRKNTFDILVYDSCPQCVWPLNFLGFFKYFGGKLYSMLQNVGQRLLTVYDC